MAGSGGATSPGAKSRIQARAYAALDFLDGGAGCVRERILRAGTR